MTIVYRVKKGAPLTAEDLDGNFRQLEKRIVDLEQSQSMRPAFKFSIAGSVLTVKNDQDEILAESIIPVLRFMPKGNWKSETAYIFNDLVCIGSEIWCALKSHKSQTTFSQDQDKWMLFASLNSLKEGNHD